MIQKIYIRKVREDVVLPEFTDKGDWVDLKVFPDYSSHRYKKGDYALLPLGVAMKLPKGYEAVIAPRSSSFWNFGFIQVNSPGVIDSTYNGDGDEWKEPVYFINDGVIRHGERICQFRIRLNQQATMLQKIKWLFTSGFKFVEVDTLGGCNRGGFGSTGVM